jgi:hypothetical protein
VEVKTHDRRPECLLMSYGKVQKLMRKIDRSKGCNAEFYVINVTPPAEQPTEFHNGQELIVEQCEDSRKLLYDDFPELFQRVNSPPLSR